MWTNDVYNESDETALNTFSSSKYLKKDEIETVLTKYGSNQ